MVAASLVLRNTSFNASAVTYITRFHVDNSTFIELLRNNSLALRDHHKCSIIIYYRPQRSWGKVVFTHVCDSVHRDCPIVCWDTAPGTRHPPTRGRHPQRPFTSPPWTEHPPLGPGTAPRSRPPPGPGIPHQHSACWEIRANSGRCASYWNAILFINIKSTWDFFLFGLRFSPKGKTIK